MICGEFTQSEFTNCTTNMQTGKLSDINIKIQTSKTKIDDFEKEIDRRLFHEFYNNGEYSASEKVEEQ